MKHAIFSQIDANRNSKVLVRPRDMASLEALSLKWDASKNRFSWELLDSTQSCDDTQEWFTQESEELGYGDREEFSVFSVKNRLAAIDSILRRELAKDKILEGLMSSRPVELFCNHLKDRALIAGQVEGGRHVVRIPENAEIVTIRAIISPNPKETATSIEPIVSESITSRNARPSSETPEQVARRLGTHPGIKQLLSKQVFGSLYGISEFTVVVLDSERVLLFDASILGDVFLGALPMHARQDLATSALRLIPERLDGSLVHSMDIHYGSSLRDRMTNTLDRECKLAVMRSSHLLSYMDTSRGYHFSDDYIRIDPASTLTLRVMSEKLVADPLSSNEDLTREYQLGAVGCHGEEDWEFPVGSLTGVDGDVELELDGLVQVKVFLPRDAFSKALEVGSLDMTSISKVYSTEESETLTSTHWEICP